MNFAHFSHHFLSNFNSLQLAKNSRVEVFNSSWLQLVPTRVFSELTRVEPTRVQTMVQKNVFFMEIGGQEKVFFIEKKVYFYYVTPSCNKQRTVNGQEGRKTSPGHLSTASILASVCETITNSKRYSQIGRAHV